MPTSTAPGTALALGTLRTSKRGAAAKPAARPSRFPVRSSTTKPKTMVHNSTQAASAASLARPYPGRSTSLNPPSFANMTADVYTTRAPYTSTYTKQPPPPPPPRQQQQRAPPTSLHPAFRKDPFAPATPPSPLQDKHHYQHQHQQPDIPRHTSNSRSITTLRGIPPRKPVATRDHLPPTRKPVPTTNPAAVAGRTAMATAKTPYGIKRKSVPPPIKIPGPDGRLPVVEMTMRRYAPASLLRDHSTSNSHPNHADHAAPPPTPVPATARLPARTTLSSPLKPTNPKVQSEWDTARALLAQLKADRYERQRTEAISRAKSERIALHTQTPRPQGIVEMGKGKRDLDGWQALGGWWRGRKAKKLARAQTVVGRVTEGVAFEPVPRRGWSALRALVGEETGGGATRRPGTSRPSVDGAGPGRKASIMLTSRKAQPLPPPPPPPPQQQKPQILVLGKGAPNRNTTFGDFLSATTTVTTDYRIPPVPTLPLPERFGHVRKPSFRDRVAHVWPGTADSDASFHCKGVGFEFGGGDGAGEEVQAHALVPERERGREMSCTRCARPLSMTVAWDGVERGLCARCSDSNAQLRRSATAAARLSRPFSVDVELAASPPSTPVASSPTLEVFDGSRPMRGMHRASSVYSPRPSAPGLCRASSLYSEPGNPFDEDSGYFEHGDEVRRDGGRDGWPAPPPVPEAVEALELWRRREGEVGGRARAKRFVERYAGGERDTRFYGFYDEVLRTPRSVEG